MKKNGAMLTVFALEQIGVRKTFGIPGIYNSLIYDYLYKSAHIEPIITLSELSAAYMADAVSRTSNSIGTVVVVQGAGISHLMSAVGQAQIDGIPLLIISSSHSEPAKNFQLHQLNLDKALDGLVKGFFKVQKIEELISTIYNAFNLATQGEPGPVLVDVPLHVQVDQKDVPFENYQINESPGQPLKKEKNITGQVIYDKDNSISDNISKAAEIIAHSKHPGIYIGWGAMEASEEIKKLAELLKAPVSTTLQGLSAFPDNHPLHTGFGFGSFAVPSSNHAFKDCDCLLAIGVKFSELSTANFQLPVPENLIHIDINPDVFNKNYQSKVKLEGDAKVVVNNLLKSLSSKTLKNTINTDELAESIRQDKQDYKKSWLTDPKENIVSPGYFFNALRNHLSQDTALVLDNGTHRFYAAELFPVSGSRLFICPTNSNCMGYGIPAAIGTKLLNKNRIVASIISETDLLLNGFELITAQHYKAAIMVFVIRDKDSGIQQIMQDKSKNKEREAYEKLYINIEKFAESIKAEYFLMKNDIDISGVLTKSKDTLKAGKNAVIEVLWDSTRKSLYTEAIDKPDLSRINLAEKIRMLFKGGQ